MHGNSPPDNRAALPALEGYRDSGEPRHDRTHQLGGLLEAIGGADFALIDPRF